MGYLREATGFQAKNPHFWSFAGTASKLYDYIQVRKGEAKRQWNDGGFIVPVMELYSIYRLHMICDLHYVDSRSD